MSAGTRIYWDECCYGWKTENGFEPHPMPHEWRDDLRAHQIVMDRIGCHRYFTRFSDYEEHPQEPDRYGGIA